jgi:HEAT repeat protein
MPSCRGAVPRIPCLLPAIVALLLAPLPVALGHGGSFRGPNGGVPPGQREPSDPEPPPAPPTDPPDNGGPSTGEPDQPGLGGEVGPETQPGGGEQPGPAAPPGSPKGGRSTKTLGYDSWRFWWAYNNDEILDLGMPDLGTLSGSALFGGTGDRENKRNPLRATQHEIVNNVLPALLACIDRKSEHEDVHGGALIAAAKLGSSKLIPLLEAVLRNTHENGRGERMDFGLEARESAVLALGLLPDLTDGDRAEVRRILLAAVADDKLRTRERTWAAVALGLRRDTDAAIPLLELLPLRYPDDNVPCGIVAGLGLIGDSRARTALEGILADGRLKGTDLPARVRPFAGYALGKLGDPAALPAVLKALGSRRTGSLVQRSAALAAGALGEHATDEAKAEAVGALLKTVRRSSADVTTVNFALVSLGRIGTEEALTALLDEAENGPHGARAFAALGLSMRVWYADRAAEGTKGAPLDPALRKRIVRKLADLSARIRDAETRAAFLLARGLVKDENARDELVEVVTRPGDATLRGFSCIALGLLGDARPEVKEALYLALAERTNVDLRRDAATALGLLRDPATVKHLIEQLRTASSFVVQGQIVTAIGAIGDRRALAPLVSLLEDMNQRAQVRALAAVGLGLIGDPRPVPALSRLSRDYNYRASVPDLDELLYIF